MLSLFPTNPVQAEILKRIQDSFRLTDTEFGYEIKFGFLNKYRKRVRCEPDSLFFVPFTILFSVCFPFSYSLCFSYLMLILLAVSFVCLYWCKHYSYVSLPCQCCIFMQEWPFGMWQDIDI